MKLFVIVLIILSLCIIGMAIKIWGKEGGKFSGTCARTPCSFCGKLPDEADCKK